MGGPAVQSLGLPTLTMSIVILHHQNSCPVTIKIKLGSIKKRKKKITVIMIIIKKNNNNKQYSVYILSAHAEREIIICIFIAYSFGVVYY